MFKFICLSCLIHAGLFYLVIFFSVLPSSSLIVNSASDHPNSSTKVSFVKIRQADFIKEELNRQLKDLENITPERKLNLLDKNLSKLSNLEVTDKVSELILDKLPTQQKKLGSSQGFNFDRSFFHDVYEDSSGNIYVILKDHNNRTLSYKILKNDVTTKDLVIVKIFSQAKKNPHLRIILNNFAKSFKKD